MGCIVELEGVNKEYGNNHVVKDLNLNVEEGEFLTLLGSSGCGKTTTLRMIAGFEEPSSGSILVQGESIAEKEPYERDVNTVFQSYALFPHMTVYDNIAYRLKMKKVPKKEIAERVTKNDDDGAAGRLRKKISDAVVGWTEAESCNCQSADQQTKGTAFG